MLSPTTVKERDKQVPNTMTPTSMKSPGTLPRVPISTARPQPQPHSHTGNDGAGTATTPKPTTRGQQQETKSAAPQLPHNDDEALVCGQPSSTAPLSPDPPFLSRQPGRRLAAYAISSQTTRPNELVTRPDGRR
jgi:hypothetical protein